MTDERKAQIIEDEKLNRLGIELRGIADCILAARELINISDPDIENALSILFAAENHLLRISEALED